MTDEHDRWRGLIDSARDAYVSIDAAGRVTEWNRQAEVLFGWTRQEALGVLLADLIVPEAYRAAHLLGIERFVRTGHGEAVFQRLQLPAAHRSGHLFEVEFTIWPSRDRDGAWTFHSFMHDVSIELRQQAYLTLLQRAAVAANEARDVEQAMRETLDALRDAAGQQLGHVYLVDHTDGGTLAPTGWWVPGPRQPLASETANTRFVLGRGLPGRVAASGHAEWISDLTQDPNYPRADAAARSGLRSTFAFPIPAGNEIVAVVELFSEAALPPDRRLLGVLEIVGTQLGRVFEREHALRELRTAAEQREAIVAIVSHELRGPLVTTHAAADLLASELAETGTEHSREMLELLDRELARLRRMVDSLLTAQRIDAGSLRSSPEPIDVGDAVQRVAADAAVSEVRVERGDGATHIVLADRDHLTQMLWNLLSNARAHGRPPITVTTGASDGAVTVAVGDAGPGVPDTLVPQLFDRFVRGAGSVGSGLGLSIARGLARVNDGDLHYQGGDEGHAFVLTLPSGAGSA
ncbi:MAG: ATP-binding protein [Nitriliruptor sp.]